MARNLNLRCSEATYKRIQTALAVRSSGLFPPVMHDAETTVEAAQVDAILGEWMTSLTLQALRQSNERIVGQSIAANLQAPRTTVPDERLEGVYLHEHRMQPIEAEPETAPKRKPKAEVAASE